MGYKVNLKLQSSPKKDSQATHKYQAGLVRAPNRLVLLPKCEALSRALVHVPGTCLVSCTELFPREVQVGTGLVFSSVLYRHVPGLNSPWGCFLCRDGC